MWMDSDGSDEFSDDGNRIGRVGAIALANALIGNNTLKELHLSGSGIGDEGAEAFAENFKQNSALKRIFLCKVEITSIGAISLANSLKENGSLEVLFLRENDIGDDGASAFAEALKENRSLRSLNLASCGITHVGAKSISGALIENFSLTGNPFGDEGIYGFAEALRLNATMRELIVDNCGISDIGVISLADALTENNTLQWIYLRNFRTILGTPLPSNIITDIGGRAIAAALKINVTLYLVDISETSVSEEISRQIDETVSLNRTIKMPASLLNRETLLELVPFRKSTISILGDSSSGKTRLVRELTGNEYLEEVDRYTEALEINSINAMTWEVDNESWREELRLGKFRGRMIAKEVLSQQFRERTEESSHATEEITIEADANCEVEIHKEELADLRQSYVSHMNEYRDGDISTLTEGNTFVADIYDFGGHEVYRSISHFFMNVDALYIIVLNLENDIDELKSQLSFYASLVMTFAHGATMFVVGTHSESMSCSREEVEEVVALVFDEKKIPRRIAEKVLFVENGVRSAIEDDKKVLRLRVKEEMTQKVRENRNAVPLMWIWLLDILLKMREDGVKVLRVEELIEIELGREFHKEDKRKDRPSIVKFPPEDIDAFVQRMKEMGMLFYFDASVEMRNFIVLDPNWLIEGMKGVVTIKEAKKLKKENPMYATNPQWREFLGSGVLTSQLLELIASVYWKGNEEWKTYFMNLLKQQSLLYRIPGGIEGEENYLVPPLLPKKPSSSLPPMSEFLTIKLERCYPPLEVYKLSFGLMKRRGWTYDTRSTRYSILLQKEFENEKVTMMGVSCDSSGMKQEIFITILEQHKKSTLGEAVMDDLLSETNGEVNT